MQAGDDCYAFSADARQNGRLTALTGAVLFFIAAGSSIVFWWTILLPLVMFVVGLAGLLMLYDGIGRLLRGGQWQIRYDGEQLIWHAPPYAEDSFTLRSQDIERIVAQVKSSPKPRKRRRRKVSYSLHTRTGAVYPLVEQSGVDIERIVRLLQANGIPLDEVED